MSADWFCKIGEKKIGPLNGQQLKTAVAKGQLKPEHHVRLGDAGPWVPAGRIKGLFPEVPSTPAPEAKRALPATAKPLGPTTGGKPATAKAMPLPNPLPTAAAAPIPPSVAAPSPADVPEEFSLGGHQKHATMNVHDFGFESAPVNVSKRKSKGVQGLKKAEQQKLNVILLSVIGVGTTFGIAVFIWGIASGKLTFSSPEKKVADPTEAATAAASAPPTEAEKKAVEAKLAAKKEAETWKSINDKIVVGKVEVTILKPSVEASPAEAKSDKPQSLIVPIKLNLKEGDTTPVDFSGWDDDAIRKNISLKDDQKGSYPLLAQLFVSGNAKSIGTKWLQLKLVFPAPSSDKLKLFHLELPAAAFSGEGMIRFGFKPNEITKPTGEAKAASDGAEGTKPATSKKPAAAAKKSDEDSVF